MSQTDWHETLRNDPRTIEELVQCALTDTDDERASDAIYVLQFRASRQILDKALELCLSPDSKRRELGADILGQFGCFETRPYPFFDETVERLVAMLPGEQEPGVLNAVGIGLGHRFDPRGVLPLSKLKSHPDDDVRYAVVIGLAGQTDPLAIQTLIDLTRDDATKVRDWATFTLGQMCDIDTPAIRESLWQRTDDSDDDTRCEAFSGLAQRHDESIVPKLIGELRREVISTQAIEAARDLGSPQLLEVLHELKGFTFDEPTHVLIDEAIVSCTKSAADMTPTLV